MAHKSAHHHHHYRPLEAQYFPIADELSLSRACRPKVLLRIRWRRSPMKAIRDGQIAQIPHRELHSFNKRVEIRALTEIETAIPAGKEALWCDDRLDEFANKYKTTLKPPLGNRPSHTSNLLERLPSGMYGCTGIGYD